MVVKKEALLYFFVLALVLYLQQGLESGVDSPKGKSIYFGITINSSQVWHQQKSGRKSFFFSTFAIDCWHVSSRLFIQILQNGRKFFHVLSPLHVTHKKLRARSLFMLTS